MSRHILKLYCQNQIGIVAAVSGFLAEHCCNIVESAHFDDEVTDLFFLRTVFDLSSSDLSFEELKQKFSVIAEEFEMNWDIYDSSVKRKAIVMVSKFEHCLNDILYRYRTSSIPLDISGIVSNHPDLEPLAKFHDIPYHYLPVTKENKKEQETRVIELFNKTKSDFIILARYMQILSSDFCKHFPAKIINIHHSFLPSFVGARPYHQAYDKGVKIIGATAHYVTPDLDQGPIIEQDIVRVNHSQKPQQLVEVGKDLENIVLARAVKYHCEHRVLVNGNKTVIFQ